IPRWTRGFYPRGVQCARCLLPLSQGMDAGTPMTDVAVVVTTYNRSDALAAVLAGFAAQSDRGFELIVADDGSKPDTAAVVADFTQRAPFPIRYVWQEDDGFRA